MEIRRVSFWTQFLGNSIIDRKNVPLFIGTINPGSIGIWYGFYFDHRLSFDVYVEGDAVEGSVHT